MSAEPAPRPLGTQRGVGFAIVLSIVTLGIYAMYWIFVTFKEVRAYRGRGVGGIGGLLLAFIIVSTFLLPSYVGRLYSEEGQHPPITGLGGFWAFIPLIGGFIWLAKIQGALNRFWASNEAGVVAALPGDVIAAPPPPAAATPGAQEMPAPAPAAPPQAPMAAPPPPPPPPAPAEAARPELIVREGPLAGRRFRIETELSLGREHADVVIDDPEVSRRHALLRWSGARLEVSDAGSSNGTFVNDERIQEPRELATGDVIRIGQTPMLVNVPQS